MSSEPPSGPAYPFVVVETESGFSGSALRFPSLATARERGELDRLMREQVALYLVEQRLAGGSLVLGAACPSSDRSGS